MAFSVPTVHNWLAGDEINAVRMNEIAAQIDFVRNPPMAHVGRASSTQNLSGATWNKIVFDTLHSTDPYEMWDAGATDRLTCTIPGWYSVEGVITVSSTANEGAVVLGIYKNGFTANEFQLRHDQQNAPSSGAVNIRKEFRVFLNVDDWIHLGEYHTDAVTRTSATVGTWEHSQLRMRWVSN